MTSKKEPQVIVLKIKNKHIKHGERCNSGHCPIALAARELYNAYKCLAVKDGILVTLNFGDKRFLLTPVNDEHEKFIKKFDSYRPVSTCNLEYKKCR